MRLTVEYDITGIYNEKIMFLSIARNSGFKLHNCYYHGYTWDEFYTSINITCFLKTISDKQKLIDEGFEIIYQSQNLLNFLIDNPNEMLSFEFLDYELEKCENKDEYITDNVIYTNSNNTKLIREFDSNLVGIDMPQFLSCINYYTRGMYMFAKGLYEESFFNSFKAIELMSNSYYESVKDFMGVNLKNEIKNFIEMTIKEYYKETYTPSEHEQITNTIKKIITNGINTKQKIKILMEHYFKYDGVIDELINNIVNLRNKRIAHGNSGPQQKDLIKLSNELIDLLYLLIPPYYLNIKKKNRFRVKLNTRNKAGELIMKPSRNFYKELMIRNTMKNCQ